jgi:XXXCH domain-containing protein
MSHDSIKHKSERLVPAEQLPELLRNFADALESGAVEIGDAQVEISELLKFGIEAKFDEGGMRVKVKARTPVPKSTARAAGTGSRSESYGRLKKRMKRDFNALRQAVQAGQLPPAELLESFLADCVRMVSYPGKGDEDYAVYEKATGALSRAAASGDLEAVRTALGALNALKHSCHAKHK